MARGGPRRTGISESEYKVEDRGYATPCWIWQLCLNNKGYGRVVTHGREMLAHRFSYTIFVGDVPDGRELDHLCGQPSCVRPDHLDPVLHVENLRRGRGTRFKGDQLAEMRRMRGADMSYAAIARRVSSDRSSVRKAILSSR